MHPQGSRRHWSGSINSGNLDFSLAPILSARSRHSLISAWNLVSVFGFVENCTIYRCRKLLRLIGGLEYGAPPRFTRLIDYAGAARACPALAKAEVPLFDAAMLGLLKDFLCVIAVIVALVVLALWSGPGEIHLTTGKTCLEIVDRLAARTDRSLTPAERTDLANCGVP
jgi:hypothetical protein